MSWTPSRWDIVKFAIAYIVFAVPFAYVREYVWFSLLTVVFIIFVLWEFLVATRVTNKETLSGRFEKLKQRHPGLAKLCLGGIILFWLYIVLHLWWGI